MQYSAKKLGLGCGSGWCRVAWKCWIIIELMAESWVPHFGLTAGTALSRDAKKARARSCQREGCF